MAPGVACTRHLEDYNSDQSSNRPELLSDLELQCLYAYILHRLSLKITQKNAISILTKPNNNTIKASIIYMYSMHQAVKLQ